MKIKFPALLITPAFISVFFSVSLCFTGITSFADNTTDDVAATQEQASETAASALAATDSASDTAGSTDDASEETAAVSEETRTDSADTAIESPKENTDSGTGVTGSEDAAVPDGWNADHIVYYENGTAVTGLKEIQGSTYYFDEGGKRISGSWKQIQGNWYYFDSDGRMAFSRWIGNYYVTDSGIMAVNRWIGRYYVGSDGKWIPDRWVKDRTGWWYRYGDGSYPKNAWVSISGRWYFFKKNGYMASSCWIGNYYVTSSGAMAVSRWVGRYYVGSDGKWIPDRWEKDRTGWQYRYGDGSRPKSKWLSLGGQWYYFNSSGYMVTGWQTIGGKQYYFKENGGMVTGSQRIDGTNYTFSSSGALTCSVNPSTRVIDVSYFQGNIDWNKVRNTGVEGVIIRAGYGTWSGNTFKTVTDAKFAEYITGAEKAGLKIGVYWFSEATTAAQAVTEAREAIRLISGHKLSLPVYFDWEYYSDTVARNHGVTVTKSNGLLDTITLAFCQTISGRGYRAGWYANNDFYRNKYNPSKLSNYSFWYAQYTSSDPSVSDMDLWQHGQRNLEGITNPVDVNKVYALSLIQ